MLDNMGTEVYEPQKLEELIVYASEKSLTDQFYGKVKLNKILFYSDFTAYRRRGRSITGAVYQHLPNGPCPHQLLPAMNKLTSTAAVIEREESTYVGTRKRVVSMRPADRQVFDLDDLTIVDEVIKELAPLNSKQVSDLSHETMAWRLTADYQEIPYGTALLDDEGPSEDDIAWLREVAAGAGVDATS